MHHKNLSRTLKIFSVTAFALISVAALSPGSAERVEASSLSENVAQASVYRAHCARCHGNDGRSNTREGRRTEASDLTDASVKAMDTAKMTRIIRNGKGDMPANKRLSAAQITALIRYVRAL